MGFLDRQNRVVDVVLTGRGRELFAVGELDFAYYSFFDDGIDYDPWSTGTLSDDQREELIHSTPMLEAPVVPDRRTAILPLEPTSFLSKAIPNYGELPRMLHPNPTGSSAVLRCDQFSSGSSFIRTGTSLAVVPLELSEEAIDGEFSVHFYVSGSSGLSELRTRTDLRGRRVLDPFVALAIDGEVVPDRPSADRPDSARKMGRSSRYGNPNKLTSESTPATSLPADVAMWGDSLTVGLGYGATTSYQTIPSRISAKSPTRVVYNQGVAGETSTQIMTRMLADATKHGLPTIIWAGHNNPAATATVISDIAAMVAALGHSNYLVLSLINGDSSVDWWSGGTIYNDIATINASLSSTYGSRYVDVRTRLVAAYDPNYAQDVVDHGHDIVPVTLRSDTFHLNNKGYQIVASMIWESILTLLGFTPTGGVVGVTLDASAQKYPPVDADEWTLALAAAGISSGNPDSVWNCEELSSQNLIDFIAHDTLNTSGTPSGNNAVTGWTRLSVNTTDGSAGMGWSSTQTVDLSTTSGLLIAYVAMTGTPAAEREIMGMGSGFDHRYVAVTAAGKIKATGLAGASVVGTATPGTTVHPIVLKVDRSTSTFKVYTDQEVLAPAWTAPVAGGKLLGIGDQIAGGAAPAAYLYIALFTGTKAELTDAQVRSLLQTLGWTVAW